MKKNNAFSLIELIVVILVIAIFLGLSVPSFFHWSKISQIETDNATCLEINSIIQDAIKSKELEIESSDYSINWTTANKNTLRTILRQLQTTSKVSKPRQSFHAFFVYLLPPYTVICLPINSPEYIDTNNFSLNNVTEEFLLERYAKTSYPQMYSYLYNSSENKIEDEPILNIPIVITPGATTSPTISDTNKPSAIGCINLPSDY